MPDKEIIEWVKQQQKSGFSDIQIKNMLLNQDYKQKDIDEIYLGLSKNNPSTKSSLSLGLKILFYVLFICINPILILLIAAIPFLIRNNILIYAAMISYCFLIGYVIAMVFRKNTDSIKEYLVHTVCSSIFFSAILSFMKIIGEIVKKLSSQLSQMESISGQSITTNAAYNLGDIVNLGVLSNNLLYSLSLLAFLSPLIYYFFKYNEKKTLVLLYLLPVFIYFLFVFILGMFMSSTAVISKGVA